MNEEEKKSVNELKEEINKPVEVQGDKFNTFILYNIESAQTILNLIEKLQKENEELKQDRNNNYQMIALAQNEMLGYMQGYEDGKKLKRSAVACVVENQQYYIMNKEIEHYKEYIEKLQKEIEHYKEYIEKLQKENEKYKQFFDLMLRLDSDYFMNCGDEDTNKLVDEILKLESEE